MFGVLDDFRIVWHSGIADDRDGCGSPVLGVLCHHDHSTRRACVLCCREQILMLCRASRGRWQAWPFMKLTNGRELALRQQWSASRLRLFWGKRLIASFPLDGRGELCVS